MEYGRDFYHSNNVAGQTLLKLVSRGSSIIGEMLRLSDHIPGVFSGEDPREVDKYKDIIFDFSYLKSTDKYDAQIEANEQNLDLDDEFRENHIEILQRFYQLFESIVRYHNDFLTFVASVKDGSFLQYSLESLITDTDGCQLLSEGVYLYGVMLYLMDVRICGPVRERIIIAYYRYKGSIIETSIRDVVKLCRATGFLFADNSKRPKKYPEDYFARFQFPVEIIEMVVGRLRGHDIYNASASYPSPQHRTTMLATQASMLYVILFFAPHILHKQEATMRGIVDRHFSDNWVIPVYMGILVDLNEWWAPYKAAKLALKNTMAKPNVENIIQTHINALPKLKRDLKHVLTDGVLIEDYVMDKLGHLLNILRDLNVNLRWIMLHRNSSNKKIRDAVFNIIKPAHILQFLIRIAQFEFLIKTMLQDLLLLKKQKWNEYKKECFDRMIELSEYFSGDKPLTRVKKNKKLQDWFQYLSEQINSLAVDGNSAVEGRKILKLINALKDVQKFHQIDNSLQLKQFLSDTENYLRKMIRAVNVREEVIATVAIVSDFSYAWEIINDYVQLMQLDIKNDPNVVLMLRATFLKMVSILEQPLVRINQCNSEDLISVSAYYSEKLVAFVRGVLDVVPRTMFEKLAKVARLRQTDLPPLELKFERKYLKEKAMLVAREHLAETTHRISVFTEGILNMKTTLFGVIEVEPQQLLEDGIRKELVSRIAKALNATLTFPAKKRDRNDLETSLLAIADHLGAFQSSFEHIQDYIKVYGLKVWQEEFSRIINYYVEQESNRFLRRKIYNEQSIFQSEEVPIPPFFEYKTVNANNFTGRVVNELISKTHYYETIYVDFQQAWVIPATSRLSVGMRTFHLLMQGLGVVGINGLDQLIGFMIVADLQRFVKRYHKNVSSKWAGLLSQFREKLGPVTALPPSPKRLYTAYSQKLGTFWKLFGDLILSVGQKQLIRRQMSNIVHFQARIDAKMLTCSFEAMNDAILHDVKAHYRKPNSKPYPSDENPVLGDLAEHLDFIGIQDPIAKIYITSDPLPELATILFLYTIYTLDRFTWLKRYNTLGNVTSKSREITDGTAMAVGLLTLLKQFHPVHTQELLALLCQYVRAYVREHGTDSKTPEIPPSARNVLHFIDLMCKYGPHVDRKDLRSYLPSYLFDSYLSYEKDEK